MFYNSCVLYKPVNFSSRAYKSIYRRLYPYLVLVDFSNKTIKMPLRDILIIIFIRIASLTDRQRRKYTWTIKPQGEKVSNRSFRAS